MRDSIIKSNKLVKTYIVDETETHALNGVDIEIKSGELASIIGPSGSGKSTLMNIIGLLDVPTSGDYLIEGINTKELSNNELASLRNKKIGFVFQNYNLINKLTAFENIELPLIYAGIKGNKRKEIVNDLLNKVGLLDKKNKYPKQLSGGEQQRVAIARALVNNPEVILADEPTGALDQKNGSDILDIIISLNKEGKTVIIITHDVNVAYRCNRIINIVDGNIASDIDNTKIDVEQEIKEEVQKSKKKKPSKKKKEVK